jgi:hypothetical protein
LRRTSAYKPFLINAQTEKPKNISENWGREAELIEE